MKTLGILAILIIVVGGIFLWSRSGTEGTPTESPEDTMMVSDTDTTGKEVPIDTEKSVVNWTGSKTLIANYEDHGTVQFKDGYILEKNGEVSGGTFTVDMTSIATLSTGKGSGESMQANHLKSEDFFNVEVYPESKLTITGIEARNDLVAENSTHLVTANLTIKDVTNPISFPARITKNADGSWEVNALFDLDRTKWNVRYGSGSFFDNLGDNVIDDMMTLDVHLVSQARGSVMEGDTN